MVLNNVTLINNNDPVNIQISGEKISAIANSPIPETTDYLQLTFNNALIFPGLTNSHDHLDFNLFPRLGDKIYNNYTEWGKFIHKNYKEEIAKVLKVPIHLREQWGIIKNLICGVTTVVNHGERLKTRDTLINVNEQYYCLHSVGFEKKWKLKLNNPLKTKLPVVIHIGEGRDKKAYDEIDQLISWNLLHKTLVGVHAVAMSDEQVKKFNAIVWCPQSNYFLLGKTARVKQLKQNAPILFGTDSTLTGTWDIWDHISLARKTEMLTDIELYNSLHINALNTWKTNSNEVKEGNEADFVVTRIKDKQRGLNAFFSTKPNDILLVVHKGNIRLFDASLHDQLLNTDLSEFSKIYIEGVCKYIKSNVPALMNNIMQYYPEAHFPISIN